ncbi:MAG: alpha-L-fucosidase [Terracidiphilus sp.]|jgi:hypothetical protein
MDRRTFNKSLGLGALTSLMPSAQGQHNDGSHAPSPMNSAVAAEPYVTAHFPPRTIEFPSRTFRRLLVDTHVPDWDDLLTDFDAAVYVKTIAGAGFQSLMQYSNSHAGLCLWRTKLGQMHKGMRGRDYFGEVMEQCRIQGIHRVAYYSLVYDDWAYETHPDWRILPEGGYDPDLYSRMGTVCINSPYREHALACLRELVGNYDFSAIFPDMTFWPTVCYCPHCTARFWKEEKAEPPRIVDWTDPTWRAFQKARERWMREFALDVTQAIKQTRPILVAHQFSTIFDPWQFGVSLEQNEASDFCSGDFYGGATEYSLVCKAYDGLTRTRPFEFMTSRTVGLGDFETTNPFGQLLLESLIPTAHSGACLFIDAIKPNGRLNSQAYEYLSQVNFQHDAYEQYLGGDLQADVAIYFDKASLYDPSVNKVPAAMAAPIHTQGGPHLGLPAPQVPEMKLPHREALIGAARILRESHIPFGVVTNATLDQLSRYRAVIVPNVLEMTPEQAERFRDFVRSGGVLYASGPSSLQIVDRPAPGFLLEDVLSVRYVGSLGKSITYLAPNDKEVARLIWPQEHASFPGSMVKAESQAGAKVLATVTLPLVDPDEGFAIGAHFAQIWSNPPALAAGKDPAIVTNSFGKGKAIWVAAPIETLTGSAAGALVRHLLHVALPGPYKFEANANPAVEITVYRQENNRRLLVSLLNMQVETPAVPVDATVRVQIPDGGKAKRVAQLPDQKEITFTEVGPYVQFHIPAFDVFAMVLVEYGRL